ncbi:TPA: hypothetical protein HA246_07210 [Candidatus Woesearchaeota archaeon]|nr:hypothetical protein [Candidatus Woesearchaeota archaeon]
MEDDIIAALLDAERDRKKSAEEEDVVWLAPRYDPVKNIAVILQAEKKKYTPGYLGYGVLNDIIICQLTKTIDAQILHNLFSYGKKGIEPKDLAAIIMSAEVLRPYQLVVNLSDIKSAPDYSAAALARFGDRLEKMLSGMIPENLDEPYTEKNPEKTELPVNTPTKQHPKKPVDQAKQTREQVRADLPQDLPEKIEAYQEPTFTGFQPESLMTANLIYQLLPGYDEKIRHLKTRDELYRLVVLEQFIGLLPSKQAQVLREQVKNPEKELNMGLVTRTMVSAASSRSTVLARMSVDEAVERYIHVRDSKILYTQYLVAQLSELRERFSDNKARLREIAEELESRLGIVVNVPAMPDHYSVTLFLDNLVNLRVPLYKIPSSRKKYVRRKGDVVRTRKASDDGYYSDGTSVEKVALGTIGNLDQNCEFTPLDTEGVAMHLKKSEIQKLNQIEFSEKGQERKAQLQAEIKQIVEESQREAGLAELRKQEVVRHGAGRFQTFKIPNNVFKLLVDVYLGNGDRFVNEGLLPSQNLAQEIEKDIATINYQDISRTVARLINEKLEIYFKAEDMTSIDGFMSYRKFKDGLAARVMYGFSKHSQGPKEATAEEQPQKKGNQGKPDKGKKGKVKEIVGKIVDRVKGKKKGKDAKEQKPKPQEIQYRIGDYVYTKSDLERIHAGTVGTYLAVCAEHQENVHVDFGSALGNDVCLDKKYIARLEQAYTLPQFLLSRLERQGLRVRIRADSEFASQRTQLGILQGEFGSAYVNERGRWARVIFEDGYSNCYRADDLEVADPITALDEQDRLKAKDLLVPYEELIKEIDQKLEPLVVEAEKKYEAIFKRIDDKTRTCIEALRSLGFDDARIRDVLSKNTKDNLYFAETVERVLGNAPQTTPQTRRAMPQTARDAPGGAGMLIGY